MSSITSTRLPAALLTLGLHLTAVFAAGSQDPHQAGDPGIDPPRPLEFRDPEYPEAARESGVEGRVILRVLVASTGMVERVEVIRAPYGGESLRQAAVEAVSRWRYEPARLDGEAVACWVVASVEFYPSSGSPDPPPPEPRENRRGKQADSPEPPEPLEPSGPPAPPPAGESNRQSSPDRPPEEPQASRREDPPRASEPPATVEPELRAAGEEAAPQETVPPPKPIPAGEASEDSPPAEPSNSGAPESVDPTPPGAAPGAAGLAPSAAPPSSESVILTSVGGPGGLKIGGSPEQAGNPLQAAVRLEKEGEVRLRAAEIGLEVTLDPSGRIERIRYVFQDPTGGWEPNPWRTRSGLGARASCLGIPPAEGRPEDRVEEETAEGRTVTSLVYRRDGVRSRFRCASGRLVELVLDRDPGS